MKHKKPELTLIKGVDVPEAPSDRTYQCRQCAARTGTESGPCVAIEVKTQFEVTPRLKVKGGEKRLICAYCYMHGEVNYITQ